MNTYIRLKYVLPLIIASMILFSCSDAGVNKTGSEYMPEMVHSVAYDANTYGYYSYNNYSTPEDYLFYAQPRLPVKNSVPRGNLISESHPYFFGYTEEERTKASNEIKNNPYMITAKGLENGKNLYNIYCGICHGEKGDGKGYLVREDGGKYLALPANFMSDDLMKSSNGRYYHAIMRGKNVMEPFYDKLDHKERWEVIQYIRSLQAASTGLVYNEVENTFNTTDMPAGKNSSADQKAQALSDEVVKPAGAKDSGQK